MWKKNPAQITLAQGWRKLAQASVLPVSLGSSRVPHARLALGSSSEAQRFYFFAGLSWIFFFSSFFRREKRKRRFLGEKKNEIGEQRTSQFIPTRRARKNILEEKVFWANDSVSLLVSLNRSCCFSFFLSFFLSFKRVSTSSKRGIQTQVASFSFPSFCGDLETRNEN